MIDYPSGSFGFSILFRIHGSAVYKALNPALMSSFVYLVLVQYVDIHVNGDTNLLKHPYAMGALIAALTFLLGFRCNFSYNRYWEACTAVHQMHSKWLDVGLELAAFHLQSSLYDQCRPPAFGAYPELTSLERARKRLDEPTLQELESRLDEMVGQETAIAPSVEPTSIRSRIRSRRRKNSPDKMPPREVKVTHSAKVKKVYSHDRLAKMQAKSINAAPKYQQSPTSSTFHSPFSQLTNWLPFRSHTEVETVSTEAPDPENHIVQSALSNRIQAWDKEHPPLFLQEAAHLLSLLSAVAFSTLRNDLEQADSPLIPFTEGAPWPHVDPDAYTADVRSDWADTRHRSITVLKYICGLTRSPTARTLYNAARPFRVVGGVSDAEIELLQAARGPMAKVALVSMWLNEFITREYLAGSTGKVAPPILSRLYQFISDGMIGYNQARKIAYIPFPFPHAQITSLFVFLVVGLQPVLILAFVENDILGFILNALTVLCFTGLHEVARELENPFRNVPNDVPLNNFQAQYNEGLMQMFTGYHRDAYWEVVVSESKEVVEDDNDDERLDEGSNEDEDIGRDMQDDVEDTRVEVQSQNIVAADIDIEAQTTSSLIAAETASQATHESFLSKISNLSKSKTET